MATTGTGCGVCENDVLAMAIEGLGEETESGRCVELGKTRSRVKASSGQGDILGYADRVATIIV